MDELIKQLYRSQPKKTYNQLDELFDVNFTQLKKLIPTLERVNKNCIADQGQTLPLHLLFEQRTPYTGTYKLTHCFEQINRPDIRFKVYFDAKLVEVISVCNQENINDEHSFLSKCSDIEMRWEVNYFLNRWLEYCLNQHYLFLV